jgi:hypothetical protein
MGALRATGHALVGLHFRSVTGPGRRRECQLRGRHGSKGGGAGGLSVALSACCRASGRHAAGGLSS